MSACFLDTNVLIYAFSGDDARKRIAMPLLGEAATVSVQSLNEFASVARRRLGQPWAQVERALAVIQTSCRPVVPLTLELHHAGLALAQRYRLSIYDAMIVAAAVASKCEVLYSEDMHAGLVIDDRLTIRNPFA